MQYEKNIENCMQKSMLEKFVSDNKIISEYKDKMLINRNMILQELNNNEMYYIYDKKGSDYLATICEKGKSRTKKQLRRKNFSRAAVLKLSE